MSGVSLKAWNLQGPMSSNQLNCLATVKYVLRWIIVNRIFKLHRGMVPNRSGLIVPANRQVGKARQVMNLRLSRCMHWARFLIRTFRPGLQVTLDPSLCFGRYRYGVCVSWARRSEIFYVLKSNRVLLLSKLWMEKVKYPVALARSLCNSGKRFSVTQCISALR